MWVGSWNVLITVFTSSFRLDSRMATFHRVETDPNYNIHTSYYMDFFLLRTRVLVNGRNTEIRSIEDGKYVRLVLCHSSSTTGIKLLLVVNTVSAVLHQYQVYHVNAFYYEESLLFHTVFSSESCLKNFILAIGEVRPGATASIFIFTGKRFTSAVNC